jgi:hypothetical protein
LSWVSLSLIGLPAQAASGLALIDPLALPRRTGTKQALSQYLAQERIRRGDHHTVCAAVAPRELIR